MSGWRSLVVRIMRVPPEPDPPPGNGVQIFRAGKNFFRYRLFGWCVSQIVALIGLLFASTFVAQIDEPTVKTVFAILEALGWAGFLAQVPFSLGVVLLDFEMRWYIVTDRSLRIREGIVNVKEKTMTFANIQNIQVRQGPLQRILGIADVEVRNAGGGGASEQGGDKHPGEQVHVGYFRGLENAQQVRDVIMAGVKKQRHAGLGDHDEPETPDEPVDNAALLAAARELLTEAKQLRVSSPR